MGTFDTLVIDKDIPLADLVQFGLACPDGHAQRGELQTKDIGAAMDRYVLARDPEGALRLYGPSEKSTRDSVHYRMEHGAPGVVEVHRTRYAPALLSTTLLAYTHCEDCQPLYFERPEGVWGGIASRELFVEFDLTFQNGRLVKVDSTGNGSRADLRAHMLKDGVGVLPDDDRVVKREIEAWKRSRHED